MKDLVDIFEENALGDILGGQGRRTVLRSRWAERADDLRQLAEEEYHTNRHRAKKKPRAAVSTATRSSRPSDTRSLKS